MKIVIALALFAIVLVLAFAGRAMLTSSRDSGDAGKRMARALALRVARLNPRHAGIGAGMLASLVEDAHRALALPEGVAA